MKRADDEDRNEMDCRRCQDRLEAFLEGALDRSAARETERHLTGCPRCRELREILDHGLNVAPLAAPDDLLHAVLERTSGSNCDRARDLLTGRIDGRLAAIDETLLTAHVAGCPGCGALESALTRLATDLSEMAAVAPDRRFLRDVLARTLTLGQRWGLGWRRLAESWARMLVRPRFGLEASYVGAVALWFLFGAPFAPLAEMPARLLGVVRQSAQLAGNVDAVQIGIKNARQSAYNAARDVRSGLTERYWATEGARLAIKRHGDELGQATSELDIAESTRALRHLGGDVGHVLQSLVLGPADTTPSTAPSPENTRENP